MHGNYGAFSVSAPLAAQVRAAHIFQMNFDRREVECDVYYERM